MESTRNWLDNLKIRVGYGISGTASIDPYSSSSSLESGWLTLGGEKTQIYNLTKIIANHGNVQRTPISVLMLLS